jgi:hypothetical protein
MNRRRSIKDPPSVYTYNVLSQPLTRDYTYDDAHRLLSPSCTRARSTNPVATSMVEESRTCGPTGPLNSVTDAMVSEWYPTSGTDYGLRTNNVLVPAGFVTTKTHCNSSYPRTLAYTRAGDGQPLTILQSSARDTKTRKTTYGYDAAGPVASTTVDNTRGSFSMPSFSMPSWLSGHLRSDRRPATADPADQAENRPAGGPLGGLATST